MKNFLNLTCYFLNRIPSVFAQEYMFKEYQGCEKVVKYVFVNGRRFTSLNKEKLALFTNAERIEIFHTSITEIPEGICELKKLTHLFLQNNMIETFPQSIKNLQNLEHLDVSYNSLQNLPEEIGELKNLQKLKVSFNILESLPRSIGNLSRLIEMDLGNNRLQDICVEASLLQNLKILNLEDNMLERIPLPICVLHSLESIYLENNHGIGSYIHSPDEIKRFLDSYYLLPPLDFIEEDTEHFAEQLPKYECKLVADSEVSRPMLGIFNLCNLTDITWPKAEVFMCLSDPILERLAHLKNNFIINSKIWKEEQEKREYEIIAKNSEESSFTSIQSQNDARKKPKSLSFFSKFQKSIKLK